VSKLSRPQLRALGLAASEPIRYFKGGWYSLASAGSGQSLARALTPDELVNPTTLHALVDRGMLVREGLNQPSIYVQRWIITDAGRAALGSQ
jgi:hypothetical protein